MNPVLIIIIVIIAILAIGAFILRQRSSSGQMSGMQPPSSMPPPTRSAPKGSVIGVLVDSVVSIFQRSSHDDTAGAPRPSPTPTGTNEAPTNTGVIEPQPQAPAPAPGRARSERPEAESEEADEDEFSLTDILQAPPQEQAPAPSVEVSPSSPVMPSAPPPPMPQPAPAPASSGALGDPIKRSDAPEKETTSAENVFFAVYHPKEAVADTWYTLLAYAHIESALAAVQTNAKKFSDEMADDPREVKSQSPARLTRGTELRFVPAADGVEFNPPSAILKWQEDYERAQFRFRARSELAGQPCFGEMSVYVGPLEIATIRFSVFVTDSATESAEKTETTTAQAKMYQRIFASYSHKDTEIVNRCVQAFKAIGYDVSIDYESLRSGEQWSDALEKLIDDADIFQLFWSEHSAQSNHVKHEWLHALKRLQATQNTAFLRPVYWETPMPPVPEELAKIHFKQLPELAE